MRVDSSTRTMPNETPGEPQQFRAVADFQTVSADKIDAICEDFRLWLHIMAGVAPLVAAGVVRVPPDHVGVFHWVDDGKHNINVRINAVQSDNDSSAVQP